MNAKWLWLNLLFFQGFGCFITIIFNPNQRIHHSVCFIIRALHSGHSLDSLATRTHLVCHLLHCRQCPRHGKVRRNHYDHGQSLTICLISTMFLMGPWRQLKSMFNEKRILSTLLVICFMILTLLAALKWKKTVLAIMFCFFQFIAYLWYSISYIPYAQDSVKKTVMSCL